MARPPVYLLDENYFKEIKTPSQAYILGFIYADGSINERSGLRIVISKKDIDVLRFIQSELKTDIPIKINKNGYADFYVNRKRMILDLIKHGICVNKTYKSQELPRVDDNLFTALLLGFFDGDGSIYTNNNEYTVSFCSNKFVLSDIKTYLDQYNINSYLRQRHDTDYSWMLDIRGSQQINRIYKLLYNDCPFCLERKKNLFLGNLSNAEKYYNSAWSINEKGEMAMQLYNNGWRQIDISKELGMPYGSVRSHIQRLRRKKMCV